MASVAHFPGQQVRDALQLRLCSVQWQGGIAPYPRPSTAKPQGIRDPQNPGNNCTDAIPKRIAGYVFVRSGLEQVHQQEEGHQGRVAYGA